MINEDIQAKIKGHYQRGEGSIQDIARTYQRYGVTVQDVLDITGNSEIKNVEFGGDLVDQETAGQGATINYGRTEPIPFTVD